MFSTSLKNILTYALPVAAILLAAAFSACGSDNKSATEKETTDTTTINIAVMPSADCLPLYVAESRGLFDSLDVKVNLIPFNSAMDCDTALLGTSADACMSDIVRAYLMRCDGDSVKSIMSTDQRLWLVTSKASRLKSLASIKERIVATTRHSALDLMLDKAMERAKFGTEEVNRPQINDIRLRAEMLLQNQYDGAILPEPYTSQCAGKGCNKLMSSEDLGLSLGALIVREDALRSKRKAIQSLVEAYTQAVDIINKGPLLALKELPGQEATTDSAFNYKFGKPQATKRETLDVVGAWAKSRGLANNVKIGYTELVDTTFTTSKPH